MLYGCVIFLFTTFIPNDDPCLPGGVAKLYALNYKTGGSYYVWSDKVIALIQFTSKPVWSRVAWKLSGKHSLVSHQRLQTQS